MLSVSTSNSMNYSGFSTNSGMSTPSSQFLNDPQNPLTELVKNEQMYIENLKMIDCVNVLECT